MIQGQTMKNGSTRIQIFHELQMKYRESPLLTKACSELSQDEFDNDSESDADNDTDIIFSRFGRTTRAHFRLDL